MNRNVGFAFPFRFDSNGRTATVGGSANETPSNDDLDAAVRAGVMQILQTVRGERVMLGDLGAGLDRFLFSPIQGLASMIPLEIRDTVKDWCPRAVVGAVKVASQPLAGKIEVGLVVRHNDSDSESILRVTARQQ